MTLNAYDIDFTDEMKIVLNGQSIDHLGLTGNNRTKAQTFTLAKTDLLTGRNQLQFVNKNAQFDWGVGQVSLSTGLSLDKLLR